MSQASSFNHMKADEVPRSVHGGGRLATFTIALEAWRRGLSVAFLDGFPYRFEVSDGEKTVAFDRALPEETTHQAFLTAKSKYETLELLKAAGVSTPDSRLIDAVNVSIEDVQAIAREIGYPVVLKPASASKGRGVFTDIGDADELTRYYKYLVEELGDKQLILESFFAGEDYRVQVVGNKVAAVTWRRAASVIGDGKQTIEELIEAKNRDRRMSPALSKDMLKVDLEVDSYVADQGYTYESVPAVGQRVRLRGKANISTGGDIIDVTDWLPNHISDAAVRAVSAVPGLVSAGVDVLIRDAADEGPESYVVIELNPRAHMGGHIFPSDGPGRNAAGVFIDHYFPHSSPVKPANYARITFRIDDIVAPLRQGSAKRVELAPLPSHAYPRRERVDYPPVEPLSSAEKRRITQEATRRGVVGALHCRRQRSRLVVAGDDLGVDQFLNYLAQALGANPTRTAKWEGVIWHGFKVEQSRPDGVLGLAESQPAQDEGVSKRRGFGLSLKHISRRRSSHR